MAGGEGFSRALYIFNRLNRQTREEGKVGMNFLYYMTQKTRKKKN